MTIKHIFSDMDGTLLDSLGRVSQENITLIKKAALPLTLVSARAPLEMRRALKALALTQTQIAFNGGLIYRYQGDLLQVQVARPLATETLNYLLDYLDLNFPDVSQSYYDVATWYSAKIDRGIEYESQITLELPTLISKKAYLKPQQPIYKVMLITFSEKTMQKLLEKLSALALNDITIQRSGPYHLEITHQKAKKSAGIAYILQEKQLLKEETAGFGDGHNDLPMFEQVGVAIAMANASPQVKQQARYVTLSNDQAGVGKGIWQYLKV